MKFLQRSMQLKRSFVSYLTQKSTKAKSASNRPLDIVSSSTYVVDLDYLQHPNDVKKDNFGVWHTVGLTPVSFSLASIKARLKLGEVSSPLVALSGRGSLSGDCIASTQLIPVFVVSYNS